MTRTRLLRLAVCLLALPVTAAIPAHADPPTPLPIDIGLLRPDSLAGWEHSAVDPSGWTIQDGKLTGAAGATPLLSGFSLGDFELRLKWTAGGNAAAIIRLPQIPDGPALAISLAEGEKCGLVTEGDKTLNGGADVAPLDKGPHTAVIRRTGEKLSLDVDGKTLYEIPVAADRRFGLGLWIETGEASVEDLRLAEPLGEPLLDGENLDGWWCPGRKEAWALQNGELVLVGRGGNYIRSEKEYGNFTLSFEYKIRKRGNSGLGIRTPRDGWPSGDGMELQILDRPNVNQGGNMAIYRNVPTLDVAHKSEDWNQVVVKAHGRMISAWVNGVLVQQVNTAWEGELKHRNLKGWIGFQDHGAKIQVRNLRVSEIPDGLGLQAWYAPRPEPGARMVLDRLMNSERLSRSDGSRGAIITTSVDEKGDHVLADLKGPGALVRLTCDEWSGELSLLFDGEEEPRIKCEGRNVERAVPRIPGARGSAPLLTYLPFQESLKIVLREGGPATYRFEMVQLPEGAAVETFSGSGAEVPKSLAAALDYRFRHHHYGTVRQHDPYLRISSDRKTLAPGECLKAAQAEGAGVVHWVQAHCAKQHLETNDLWFEVTIDGQPGPAVSAPVQYFFSGAAVAGRYGNYLLTERDGPIIRLAMPFGNGIQMSLSNRGEQPIEGVGLTASIQQAANKKEEADFKGRLRLRGVFQPAATEQAERTLFAQKGHGRWVGFVCSVEEAEGTVVDSLQIDGQPAKGWVPASLEDLLGRPGNTEEFRGALAGRQGGLAWRYLLLAPIGFEHKIVATVPEGTVPGGRLALFYVR